MLGRRCLFVVLALLVTLVGGPTWQALGHDHRMIQLQQELPAVGKAAPPNPATVIPLQEVADSTSLGKPIGVGSMPESRVEEVGSTSAARPMTLPVGGELTNLPENPQATFSTPADACDPGACLEYQVQVPPGSKALYATIAWEQPSYYLHLWGIAPDAKVIGEDDVQRNYDKELGNERTIPRAQFTFADPQPGLWRVQARAVFGYKVAFDGTIAVSPIEAVLYDRMSVLELADRFVTQPLRVNVVFVGRTPDQAQVQAMKDLLPGKYRASVLQKSPTADCPNGDNPVECSSGLNWATSHFSGTRTSKDDEEGDAGGNVPYFEALAWNYSYRLYAASEAYTRDLFGAIRDLTVEDAPFDERGTLRRLPEGTTEVRRQSGFLQRYNAERGRFRGADAIVPDASKRDSIDAYAVEDWIFNTRLDPKYAEAFTDLESGRRRDGAFITPDPGAYYDPFYTGRGFRDLDRMPQGPSTSATLFVLDTFTSDLAREYFRPDAYHSYDVSSHFVDPDTGEEDGPDFLRFWGGRYRFFFLDIGAMPNNYETAEAAGNTTPTDSASYPNGDPPVWEALNNPVWEGETTLYERIARNVRTTIFFRFTAPYLYRPLPADVFFLASNNWSDFYSRPEGGGVSHTELEKIYQRSYVEKNLASALPAATFTTERSDPGLKTHRYLGCSDKRAGSSSEVLPTPKVLVPDPTCTNPDPIQRVLEEAKSQGDDLVGPGVPDFAVSATVVRNFVEAHREELAPLRPGQLTLTSISVVFPGASTWYLPAIISGVAFPTPNGEIWGIFNSVNARLKTHKATDCARSLPTAPGCNGVPPVRDPGSGFSYIAQHEASHFLGLLHPHDSYVVEKDDEGNWEYYAYQYVWLGDFSQAPTTYAGAFFPYSVLDQDIIQRGHVAEYLRMAQDHVGDAYLQDGIAGGAGPTEGTRKRQAQMERWRDQSARLLRCGDNLHAEYAARNAFLAAQGVEGPVVAPRPLQPGERVLFSIEPQAAYGPDGPIGGCAAASPTTSDYAGEAGGAGSSSPPLAALGSATVSLLLWRRRPRFPTRASRRQVLPRVWAIVARRSASRPASDGLSSGVTESRAGAGRATTSPGRRRARRLGTTAKAIRKRSPGAPSHHDGRPPVAPDQSPRTSARSAAVGL